MKSAHSLPNGILALFLCALSTRFATEPSAASFPGQSSAAFARLDESSLIWINPSRLADSGKGFDVGIGSGDGASRLHLALHLPAGYSLGWEYATLRAPEESYEYR